jgi:regulator of cell morphogenesis and NO signaling
MQTYTGRTIRDIALASPETTRVFEELKIDYCCGGRKPLTEACLAAGLDPLMVAQKIDSAIAAHKQNRVPHAEDRPVSELVDHIIATHHVFTASEIERLRPLMEKVRSRHGEHHPELNALQVVFEALADSLAPHMRKEEMVLFPYIKALAAAEENHAAPAAPMFGTVENPIRMMMAEHDTDGERLRKLREISNDYTLPADACPSFTALYAGLEDLERDLHQHIHLENNVLFPRSIELEHKLGSPV